LTRGPATALIADRETAADAARQILEKALLQIFIPRIYFIIAVQETIQPSFLVSAGNTLYTAKTNAIP
jgi:hypothetical protein